MTSLAKLLTISAFTLVLSGCLVAGPVSEPAEEIPPAPQTQESEETTDEPAEEAVDEPTEEGETSAEAPEEPTELVAATKSTPQFIEYSEAKRQELLANGEAHVLFFHADWCPTCRHMEDNFNETLSSFPNGTVILKASFDKDKDLKKEYGVRSQSSVTVVGASGQKLVTLVAPENDVLKSAISESFES